MPKNFYGENEEHALLRYKIIWTNKYPSQPFEISVSFGAWVRYSTIVVATSSWLSFTLVFFFFFFFKRHFAFGNFKGNAKVINNFN